MESYSKKLKDPSTLRIFFSSPFGGMEGEREELTRRYFPHINHICNSRGVQFVAVDMRWGITSEASASAQVINICLRELERSDMFIGFFGQRYGWHGADDKALQENFDNAVGRYPWIDDVRDKSVTELEFLHGHLNHPGVLPAFMCFRDKAFDDEMCEKGKREDDKKMVFKYSPESDNAVLMMEDLQRRCKETESQSLGVKLSYENPKEGAKLMFNAIHAHLTQYLMISSVYVVQDDQRELASSLHRAFLANKVTVYEGGQQYMAQLTRNIDLESPESYLVTGPVGCGKSALLCNWIDRLTRNPSYHHCCVVYHFVGCAKDSARITSLLKKITEDLEKKYADMKGEEASKVKEPENEQASSSDARELMRKMCVALEKLASLGKQPIVVIDGLEMIKKISKVEKPVFWLPMLPKPAVLVVSTKDSDEENIAELKSRNFQVVELPPLDVDIRKTICVKTLHMAGKELSEPQLDRIVQAKQTENAMFMKIVLNELVAFGYFRLLDQKIDSLVSCESVDELFEKMLQRLEEDYNVEEHEGNLVEEVMCYLCLSRQGLAEREITSICGITSPSTTWLPLYYAIENYITNQAGHIFIGINELRNSIYKRYLHNPDTKEFYLKKMINHFQQKRKSLGHFSGKVRVNYAASRVAYELPFLLKSLGDKEELAETLLNVQVASTIIGQNGNLYLIDILEETGLEWEEVAERYIKSVEIAMVNAYIEMEETDTLVSDSPGLRIMDTLKDLRDIFGEIGDFHASEKIIKFHIKICEENLATGKLKAVDKLMESKYHLACLYVDHGQFPEAETLHHDVLDHRKRIVEEAGDDVSVQDMESLGMSYHGIHVLYQMKMDFEMALEYLEKSIELQELTEDNNLLATSYMNMGNIKRGLKQFDEALDYSMKALKMYEDMYFGHMPPIIGNLLTNIGLIYRQSGDLDKAEDYYYRSLVIKRRAFGEIHIDIPISLMNLGTLEGLRGNMEKSLQYFEEGLNIYKALNMMPNNSNYLMMQENVLLGKWKLNRFEETLQDFFPFFDVVEQNDRVDFCLGWFISDIVKYLVNNERYTEALRLTLTLVHSNLVTGTNYVHLDFLDSHMHPPNARPVRPDNLSLDAGLERWPDSAELIQEKAVKYLIPNGESQEFVRLLNKMHDCTQYGVAVYDFGLGALDRDNVNIEMLLAVSGAGLEKYPDHVAFLRNIVSCQRAKGQHDLALHHLRKLLELEPEDSELYLAAIGSAVLSGNLDLGREYCHMTKEHFPDNQELADKVDQLMNVIQEAKEEMQNKDTNPNDQATTDS